MSAALGAVLLVVGAAGWAQEQGAPAQSERMLLEQPGRVPSLIADKRITPGQIPNPHWRPDGCGACHQGTPSPGKLNLRSDDRNALCNTCHDSAPVPRFEHLVGVAPPRDMLERMAVRFTRENLGRDGTLTCTTCHDLPMQCQAERSGARGLNPRFLRGGPYQTRTQFCFLCHDSDAFQRLNPHEQIARDGKLKEGTCIVCHRKVPDVKTAHGAKDADLIASDDINSLCTGCHRIRLHPGGFSARGAKLPNHMAKPSPKMVVRLEQVERKQGVAMPLDERGRIICATCHNPHQRGVLGGARDPGGDQEHRLRMKNICLGCHDM